MKKRKGNIMVIFVMMLPVLIGIVGLVVDGGLVFYYQTQLDMATEAASLATLSSYNVPLYDTTGAVELGLEVSRSAAIAYLDQNMKAAQLLNITVEPKNTCTIETQYEFKYVFMVIFGLKSVVLKSTCTTIGG